VRTLPEGCEWATDPHQARTMTLDRIHALLLTALAHDYQIELDMDAVEDMEDYKMLEKEWFRNRQRETVLMALLKSPVG